MDCKPLLLHFYNPDCPCSRFNLEQLAQACGVYAISQAALVDAAGTLYYRGNYNKSRYCTTPHSNYTQMAIDSLLAGTPAPTFDGLATTPTVANCQLFERRPQTGGKETGGGIGNGPWQDSSTNW